MKIKIIICLLSIFGFTYLQGIFGWDCTFAQNSSPLTLDEIINRVEQRYEVLHESEYHSENKLEPFKELFEAYKYDLLKAINKRNSKSIILLLEWIISSAVLLIISSICSSIHQNSVLRPSLSCLLNSALLERNQVWQLTSSILQWHEWGRKCRTYWIPEISRSTAYIVRGNEIIWKH